MVGVPYRQQGSHPDRTPRNIYNQNRFTRKISYPSNVDRPRMVLPTIATWADAIPDWWIYVGMAITVALFALAIWLLLKIISPNR